MTELGPYALTPRSRALCAEGCVQYATVISHRMVVESMRGERSMATAKLLVEVLELAVELDGGRDAHVLETLEKAREALARVADA